MEAGQAVFHIAEHSTEYKLEPKHRKKNAKGGNHPNIVSVLVEKWLPPVDRDAGILAQAIDNQRV